MCAILQHYEIVAKPFDCLILSVKFKFKIFLKIRKEMKRAAEALLDRIQDWTQACFKIRL